MIAISLFIVAWTAATVAFKPPQLLVNKPARKLFYSPPENLPEQQIKIILRIRGTVDEPLSVQPKAKLDKEFIADAKGLITSLYGFNVELEEGEEGKFHRALAEVGVVKFRESTPSTLMPSLKALVSSEVESRMLRLGEEIREEMRVGMRAAIEECRSEFHAKLREKDNALEDLQAKLDSDNLLFRAERLVDAVVEGILAISKYHRMENATEFELIAPDLTRLRLVRNTETHFVKDAHVDFWTLKLLDWMDLVARGDTPLRKKMLEIMDAESDWTRVQLNHLYYLIDTHIVKKNSSLMDRKRVLRSVPDKVKARASEFSF